MTEVFQRPLPDPQYSCGVKIWGKRQKTDSTAELAIRNIVDGRGRTRSEVFGTQCEIIFLCNCPAIVDDKGLLRRPGLLTQFGIRYPVCRESEGMMFIVQHAADVVCEGIVKFLVSGIGQHLPFHLVQCPGGLRLTLLPIMMDTMEDQRIVPVVLTTQRLCLVGPAAA